MLLKSAWPLSLCALSVALAACDGSSGSRSLSATALPATTADSPLSIAENPTEPATPTQLPPPKPPSIGDADTPAGMEPAGVEDEGVPDAANATDESVAEPDITDNTQSANSLVIGDPGAIVDCSGSLPCRWVSADEGFSVTVTDADNIGPAERLMVRFRIDTLYDSSLLMPSAPDAMDSSMRRYLQSRQQLGNTSGIVPVDAMAGVPVEGSIVYQDSASGDSLSLWALSLIDNEQTRTPSFTSLPIGAPQGAMADCDSQLPCSWTSSDGAVSITILAAGRENGSGWVSVTFSVTTREDSDVSLDAGSLFVGGDGVGVDELSHALGNTQSFERISHPTFAEIPLRGSVRFHHSTSAQGAITRLKLKLFENSPNPRWNPTFSNLPLQ